MNSLAFIDSKNFSDFIERMFMNAVTPPIIILLIVFLFKYKKMEIKVSKPFCLILVFYVAMDLFLRLYYTFILNMENQTRYFLIQAIFYLIPAAAAYEFIVKKSKTDKNKISVIICAVIFLYGAIMSLKPKWDKPEYEVFGALVAQDPAEYKYIEELKENKDGSLTADNDYRLAYYSGIYRRKDIFKLILNHGGSIYYVGEKKYDSYGNYKLEKISEVENRKGDKKYLFKAVLPQ